MMLSWITLRFTNAITSLNKDGQEENRVKREKKRKLTLFKVNYFLEWFQVHSNIEQKVQESFDTPSSTCTVQPSPINILYHSGPLVRISEPTLTQYYQPRFSLCQSSLYILHSMDFWQMCLDITWAFYMVIYFEFPNIRIIRTIGSQSSQNIIILEYSKYSHCMQMCQISFSAFMPWLEL